MARKFDVVVIGGGPGGYVAAIKAAQNGLSVGLVEKSIPGGVCLNWGCIPTKSLISDASRIAGLGELAELGISVSTRGLNYAKVQSRSRAAAATLANGVAGLLRKNKVCVIAGVGSIAPGRAVKVIGDSSEEIVEAGHIIVATGSRPVNLPNIPFDGTQILSSDDVLALTQLPRSIAIVGGGAIGCEFAYVMNHFGVEVTLIEAGPQLLPAFDSEVASGLQKSLCSQGIHTRVGCKVENATKGVDSVTLTLAGNDQLSVEQVLVAVGRRANTAGIGLDTAGVKLTKSGHILTGDWYQTNVPGIYAIGDVTEGPALAHVASASAAIVVEHIVGRGTTKRIDPDLIPSAVYCEPQVAGFGLTERQCVDGKRSYSKSTFPFAAVGKAVTTRHTEGFVKILADKDTGEILGASLLGHGATELVHELLLAKSSELLVEDIASMVHAHPTLSEGVLGAAEGVFGKAVHI